MFTRVSLLAAVLLVVAMLAVAGSANAAAITWANIGTNFETPANWGGTAPQNDTTTDVGVFNSAVTNQPTLSAGRSIAGLDFVSPAAGGWNLSGAFTLTLGAGTVDNGNFGIRSSNTGSGRGGPPTVNTISATGIALDVSQSWSSIGGALNVSSLISGVGKSLTKEGSGELTLLGANTFDGGFTLNTGSVNIENASALGSGTFTIKNGTTVGRRHDVGVAAGTMTLANPVTIEGNFTYSVSTGGTGTNNANVEFGGPVSLGTSAGPSRTITVDNHTAYMGSSLIISGKISDGTNATPAVNLIKAGAGNMVLSGDNRSTTGGYSGTTTINDGNLKFAGINSIGGTPLVRNVTASGNGAAVAGYAIDQAFLDRIVTTSTGVVALGVDSNINLDFSALGNAWLGAGYGTNVTYSGLITTVGDYQLGGGGGTLTMSQKLTGNNAVIHKGGGTVKLTAANDYTGVTTVTATGAVLIIGNNNALGTTDGTAATGTEVGGNNGILQMSGGITVTGEALKMSGNNDPAILQSLSGSNTWAGNITVTSGTATKAASFSTSVAGANLTVTGNVTITCAAAGYSFGPVPGSTITMSGILGDATTTPSALSGNAQGTLVLSNLNTYTGVTSTSLTTFSINTIKNVGEGASSLGAPTTVANGTISIGAGNASGILQYTGTGSTTNRSISIVTPSSFSGGTIDQSGTGPLVFTTDGVNAPTLSPTLTGAHTITFTGSTAGTGQFDGVISNGGGTLGVTKTGTGLWTLSALNTYTGKTQVGLQAASSGTLSVTILADGGSPSAIGASTNAASNLVIGNGGTLRYAGAGGAAGTTDRLFTMGAFGVSRLGTLDASGSGAVNFTNAGGIFLEAASSNSAAVLTLTGTNTGNNTLTPVFANSTGGNSSLVKNGVGTWVFPAATTETYTGATTINAGLLKVDGTLDPGSAVAVNATSVSQFGTLGGVGTMGVVTVAQYAHLAPGDSPGTLHTGNLNFGDGAAYDWEYGSPNSDLVAVTGTLTFGATATLNIDPSAPGGDYTLFTYTGTDPTNPTWTFAGSAQAASVTVDNGLGTVTLHLAAVPEPATLAFLAIGGATMLGAAIRRRRFS